MVRHPESTPLAIIGMSCCLPGADNLEEYWRLILQGRTAIDQLPPDRFDRSLYFDPRKQVRGKSYSTVGAMASWPDCDLLPAEVVKNSDVAHLAFCQIASNACRHAGLDVDSIPYRNCGVYVGHANGTLSGESIVHATLVEQTAEYLKELNSFRQATGSQSEVIINEIVHEIREKSPQRNKNGGPYVNANQAAALVSLALNLSGPALAVNAACASSMVALAIAARALEQKQIDMAIVGGLSYFKADCVIQFSKALSVSAKSSRPFDENADGLVAGEGCAAVVVQPLDRALADNNPIQAVIRGIGISSDGRGKSLWTPSKAGQISAMQRAYGSKPDFSTLGYVEAHATSTQVGDVTELTALCEFLKSRKADKVPIGSVKANIGHTLEVAGVAGLIKSVLAIQNKTVPPTIHADHLNPKIDWNEAPVKVANQANAWPSPREASTGQILPRRAAINSFGIGGLNAHVVLDEYLMQADRQKSSPVRLTNHRTESEIAVIGAGAIFAGARNLKQFKQLLMSGNDPKCDVPPNRWDSKRGCQHGSVDIWHSSFQRGGFITDYAYDWRRHKIPPKQIEEGDPLQFMLLDVVDQALQSGGYSGRIADAPTTGVVVGTAIGGDFLAQLQMGLRLPVFRQRLVAKLCELNIPAIEIEKIANDFENLVLTRMPALLDRTGSYSPSTLASRITKTFNLNGGGCTVDASNDSAFAAISVGMDWLRSRHCDLMICAAGQRAMDLASYVQLSLNSASAGLTRPIEEMVPGEGAGVVLLKRLSDARRDGDDVLAILHSVGSTRGNRIEAALGDLKQRISAHIDLKPEDIDAIEANVTGPASLHVSINSMLNNGHNQAPATAHQAARIIGNTGGASGMASLLKLILDFRHSETAKRVSTCVSIQTGNICCQNQAGHLLVSKGVSHSHSKTSLTSDCEVMTLAGDAYEMGRQHGRREKFAIRAILDRTAGIRRRPIFEPANMDAFADSDSWFSKQQLDEMRGIADGAEVSRQAIAAHNLRMAGDISGGGCVQAAIYCDRFGLIHAANEDLPIGRSMPNCLKRTVQLRQPNDGWRYLVFAIAGQVCGINGMNEQGLSVTGSMLLNLRKPFRHGKLHNILVQKLLQQTDNIPDAIELIRSFAGQAINPWGMILGDGTTGKSCYVEYDPRGQLRTWDQYPKPTAANHCRLLESTYKPDRHSSCRLKRFQQLTDEAEDSTDPLVSMQKALRDQFDGVRGRVTRHATMNTIRRVDNQISVVMCPKLGKACFTNGSLDDDDNRFYDFAFSQHRTASLNQLSTVSVQPKKVCQRFVLRSIASPAVPKPSSIFPNTTSAWIVGDNCLADALGKRIQSDGGRATILSNRNPESTLSHLTDLWNVHPATHLFLMTSMDEEAKTDLSEDRWNGRISQGVMFPYLVTQKWHQLAHANDDVDQLTVVACTSMGGDFGLSGRDIHVEGGGMTGLIKALQVEFGQTHANQLRTRVIDFGNAIPSSVAVDLIARETFDRSGHVEIGYPHQNDRRIIETIAEPLQCTGQAVIKPTGTWLVTGGARGVTAEVAKVIGSRFGLKLHLIGSSPIPNIDPTWLEMDDEALASLKKSIAADAMAKGEKPIEAWRRTQKSIEIHRNLAEFRALNVETVYHACDVSDRSALAGVIDSIRRRDGTINGVIHGAGYEKSCRFSRKDPKLVRRTIAAKVDGAAALVELTRDDPLQAFIAFGSVSGRLGALGQTDYCLANDMLAKLIAWFRTERPDCPATLFHWPAWDEVGMAVRPETKGLLERSKLKLMPTAEGANNLIDELLNGLPEREILIVEPGYRRNRSPNVGEISNGNANGKPNARTGLPLIDEIIEHASSDRVTTSCHLNPRLDPFLTQHYFRGRPFLPIVIGMEALLQTASLLSTNGQQVVELRDVEAVSGLSFFTDRVQRPQIRAKRNGDLIDCQLVCDFHNRSGQLMRTDVLHLSGKVQLGDRRLQARDRDLKLPTRSAPVDYPQEREEVLFHGPIFRNAERICVDEKGGWTWLTAPTLNELAGHRSTEGWVLSPGLLDSMMFSCGFFVWVNFDRAISIPQRIGKIRLGRSIRPGEECVQKFRMRKQREKNIHYDFTLYGDNGDVIYEIEDYQSVFVRGRGLIVQ